MRNRNRETGIEEQEKRDRTSRNRKREKGRVGQELRVSKGGKGRDRKEKTDSEVQDEGIETEEGRQRNGVSNRLCR